MESELFTCGVCYQEYNLSDRVPRTIIPCTHVVCLVCLSKILNNQNLRRCPFDKHSLVPDIYRHPINFVLRELLEKRSKTSICEIHNKERNLVCITEKKQICVLCLSGHIKNGHEVEAMQVITKKSEAMIKEIKDLQGSISNHQAKLKDTLKKEYCTGVEAIRKKFCEMKSLIENREREIIFEALSFYKIQENKVDYYLGDNSQNVKLLTEKCSHLTNNEMLVLDSQELEENMSVLKQKLNFTAFNTTFNERSKKMIQTINESFGNSLKNHEALVSEIKVKFENLSENSIPQIKESEKPNNLDIFSFKINSRISFTFKNMALQIRNTYQNPQEILFDAGKWLEAQTLSMSLTDFVDESDLFLISYIWNRLTKPSDLYLLMTPEAINPGLCQVLAKGPNHFSSITINTKEYNSNEDDILIPLIQKMLSNMNKLKALYLYMEQAILSNQCIQTIFDDNVVDKIKLEILTLDLRYSNISDEELKSLFVPMPYLREFRLYLHHAKITDRSLELCNKFTLSSAKFLADITFILDSTEITDAGVKNLLNGLRKIKQIRLGLNFTRITDRALSLLPEVLENSDLVEAFSLNLKGTNITSQISFPVFQSMPNVKSYFINLVNTQISDETIEAFIEKTLSSMKKIEILEIWLVNTKISDSVIRKLLLNVANVKRLTLGLSSTLVTDETMEIFMQEKLPYMSNLKALDIRSSNTMLSFEMQDEIRALMQKYKN